MRYFSESRELVHRREVRAGGLVQVKAGKGMVEGIGVRRDMAEHELGGGATGWAGRVLLTIGQMPRAVKPTRTIVDWVKVNRWHVRRLVVVSVREMYACEAKD